METTRTKLPENPREKASFISVLFFSWTLPLFRKGYGKILEVEDIFRPLNVDRSDLLGNRLEINWNKQCGKLKRPSLLKAIFWTFWREYVIFGVICFFNDVVVRLLQPFLLGQLLLYFRKDSTMSHRDAVFYATAIISLNGVNALLVNQFFILAMHNGMKVRVSVCSVIYRKALRLSQTAMGQTAPGKIVNLLSNDVNRFDIVSLFLNAMWTAPLMALIVGYLLWVEVAWAGMIGIGVVFIVVPIQSYTGKLSSIYRLQTALRTDERVRFMDEIISGVQVIKMYAWERPFAQLIALARRLELKIVRKTSYVRALYMTFMLFTTRMAMFCTMLAIALLYGSDHLTSDKVFVISVYFALVSHTMSQMFVRGVAEIAEALVSFRRLQSFLELDEKKIEAIDANTTNGHVGDTIEQQKVVEMENPTSRKNSISLKNVTARWTTIGPQTNGHSKSTKKHEANGDVNLDAWKDLTLNNLNVDFPTGKLIGVVGPVGAGKSSLLQALLHELPLESGSMSIKGSVSYACQEPWVFAGSVRQNILFGQEMDRERYDAVVKTCALIKDFEQLENGDRTIIGDRGASLSGGQKARINLARAAYRQADVYLLDDPLSAVDAHVGRHLFNQCIGPRSRLARLKSTRILVTHQVHFLKDADWILVLRDGKIEVQGSPAELAHSGVDFAELIGENEYDEHKRSRPQSRTSSIRSISSTSLCSLAGEPFDEIEVSAEEPEQVMQMESSSKGKVKGSNALNYFTAGAHWSILGLLGVLFLLAQLCASGADYWVSYFTKQEELRLFNGKHDDSIPLNYYNENSTSMAMLDDIIDPDSVNGSPLLSTEMCLYVHGGLMLGLWILASIRSFGFYTITVRASQKLHDTMFSGIVSTTMRFFDTNPSGRILNRFSKDMGAVDEFLPKAFFDATQVILNMGGAVFITALVNPLFLIPLIVMSIIFAFIRKIYLKTSKNIKRLEGISKSPVFTHFAATLGGLSTIRAFGAEHALESEFDNHQDIHSACWYMFISTSSAFGLSLDIMCMIFIFCITFTFLLIDTGVSGDKVGLAITQAMSLTGMLQWGIRQSAEATNQLMSVERILEYRDLEPEKQPTKARVLAKAWPERGQIEFKNVVYRYFAEAEPVLRGLSFVVLPMEKIGIVGRTGAGKSSLIGALFRLARVDGGILIDNIDTATIQLSDLRSRIAIIPQDPVLFSGTLRRNLDPFEEYPDVDIWNALKEVELKEAAGGPLGLQSAVMAHGSNFSVGQRQLLCLARAILRKNRILVLDEATANVDPQTDSLIQQTIRVKFAECTILTVAHRLHTIIDSDRVLVMDTGRAIEFDEPHNLLQNSSGIFHDMVKTLGPQEFERLAALASEQYNSKHKNA